MATVTIGSSQAITTTTVTKPTGVVDGSVLVVRYHWFSAGDKSASAPTMSDSFVRIVNNSYYDSGQVYSFGVAFFRKVITNAAGEPSTYTITTVGSTDVDLGLIVRLVNCDTTTPETDTGTNAGSATPQTTGAVIDAGADDLLLMGVTVWTQPVATPSGMTQDYEIDGGDIEGWSENPGVVSGATRSSATSGGGFGTGDWANAFAVFKAGAGGGASVVPVVQRQYRARRV